jgi:hypothetical protein
MLAQTTDPDGRTVILDEDGWGHILIEHPEMAIYRDATISAPEHRRLDPRPHRERYYRRVLGPSRWLFAVVHFNDTPGRIVTAYGTRKNPSGWIKR